VTEEKKTFSEFMRVIGGRKSPAKARAARENGKKGGRPSQYSTCPYYRETRGGVHQFQANGLCACGKTKKEARL
jgi:hypothetical protein